MAIELDFCINGVVVYTQTILNDINLAQDNILSARLNSIHEQAVRLQELNLSQKMLLEIYQLRANLTQPISQLVYQSSKLSSIDMQVGIATQERINQIILLSQYAHWYVDVLKSMWVQFTRSYKDEVSGRLNLEPYLKWYVEHRVLQRRFQEVRIDTGLPDIDGIDFQVQQLLKGVFSIALDLDSTAMLDLNAYQSHGQIWVQINVKGQADSLPSLLHALNTQNRYYQSADQNPEVTNATRPFISSRKVQEIRLSELSLYSARKAAYRQHGELIIEADKANLNLIFSLPIAQDALRAS